MRCKISELYLTQYLKNHNSSKSLQIEKNKLKYYAEQHIFARYKFQHKTLIIVPRFTKLYAEFYKNFVDLCKTG